MGPIPTSQGQSGASDSQSKYVSIFKEFATDYPNAQCRVVLVWRLYGHKFRHCMMFTRCVKRQYNSAFTTDATCTNKSCYSRVVGRLNILVYLFNLRVKFA